MAENDRYVLVKARLSWPEARHFCKYTVGTHLALVANDQDQAALEDVIFSDSDVEKWSR